MEKVLIVSKTRMTSGLCVSGLTSSNRSVRLIPPGRSNQANDTKYEIGQVWDIDFVATNKNDPPHVEDVIVINQSYVKSVSNLRKTLLQRVQPWNGGPECLFDGLITLSGSKGYIPRSGPIPSCSTGYWLPNRPLVLKVENGKPYYYISSQTRFRGELSSQNISIKFVGSDDPIERILPGTLVRVSLARWFQPGSVSEERCYLQISGWYL